MLLLSVVNHRNVDEIFILLNQLTNFNTKLFKVHLIDNYGDFDNVELKYDFVILKKFDGLIRGFGANHNLSMLIEGFSHICIINPDVSLVIFDVEEILECQDEVCTALTLNNKGSLNDYIRKEDSVLFTIFSRFFPRFRNGNFIDQSKVWFSGAFLVMTMQDFKSYNGFNEKYFMYYEDAELCRRLRNGGLNFKVLSNSVIIHEGKRASLGNFKHFIWHLRSFIRFYFNI